MAIVDMSEGERESKLRGSEVWSTSIWIVGAIVYLIDRILNGNPLEKMTFGWVFTTTRCSSQNNDS